MVDRFSQFAIRNVFAQRRYVLVGAEGQHMRNKVKRFVKRFDGRFEPHRIAGDVFKLRRVG